MDPKQTVFLAQTEIIDALAACENNISLLYHEFSQLVPEMRDFWNCMSHAEKIHATMLLSMHKLLDSGYILFGIGRFNQNLIRELDSYVCQELRNCEEKAIFSKYALSVAIKIESSLIDSHFYEITTSDAPQFIIVANHMRNESASHLHALQAKMSGNTHKV